MYKILFAAIIAVYLAGCSAGEFPLYELPPDWKEDSVRIKTIDRYTEFLEGRRIFIDPGHGGEDRRNKSRDGKIIEADVNLKVALYLKEYLEMAGAKVYMSRTEDITVPLQLRPKMADSVVAELFVSIHHNASSKEEDNYTNYTSTFYHARRGNYEYEPCNNDLAKYIQRDLSYVMGNPGGLGSFDGTYSDYIIYPGEGFYVLRNSKIPAVLVECGFHTSRLEILRLNDDTFNKIQAWGIFRGIAKYFMAGIPQITFLPESLNYENDTVTVSFKLSDKYGIDIERTEVYLNKSKKNFYYDTLNSVLTIKERTEPCGEIPLRIICANKRGNHSFPYRKKIVIYCGEKRYLFFSD
ncbi:cell wall hydrolase/autolysin [Melioribacter roseus P3M-2]|uniref:N-acetylmuramoyl-L-alanine amidase n=1 Tax=Melioribacter roseus (strain DSM 23840 / JCM 17771 / VKM B-2668 / P3M-2) TaxID=1191523 RepID=I6ZWY6_MELRP|nr:N-acetylmuramoyl-L-alanine amidase [Melioribacter roseus]AFN73573.1 cell wall hydrolase/autolysin [Melioribacter roseus P3M-2]